MVDFHHLKSLLQKGNFMRKIGLKDVFYNTNSQGTQEVPSFQIGVKPFRISLNVFRPWPSTLHISQINKSSNSIVTTIKQTLDYLSGQHANTNWQGLYRNKSFQRDSVIYLLQNLGFILNLKKSFLGPSQKTEFLGMVIGSVKMEI